ncbi:hypothetical protein [Echinicola sp. 20G]|uniref:hypothetical protein n=1 Tax=Echinicola sp. 20G TaxID=2781961 RepID=UPI00190FFCF3|nr:hypothetical protein [Echinicola sp. 20G]
MTGGAGFSRSGQASFQNNRDLRTQRKTMSENPYAGGFNGNRDEAAKNFKELRQWRKAQEKQELRKVKLVVGVLLAMALVTYLLTLIF